LNIPAEEQIVDPARVSSMYAATNVSMAHVPPSVRNGELTVPSVFGDVIVAPSDGGGPGTTKPTLTDELTDWAAVTALSLIYRKNPRRANIRTKDT